MSKEYIFTLDVDDEDVIWKCVVHDDEVVTYEGDVECKRLKITNPEKKVGVLQIDCVTKVYDEILPFQLENGVPYIKLEGKWTMSDTTLEDRIQAKISNYKKESFFYFLAGIAFVVYYLITWAVTGDPGEWPIAPIFGFFAIASAASTMIRLKNELDAMGRKLDWKLTKEDFKKK